jgi:hypothetical protein
MNEEKRPGGLTALAVINFIFFALYLVGILGWFIVLLVIIEVMPTEHMTEAQKAQMQAFEKLGMPVFVLIFILSFAAALLLLLSGIGYIKQKKYLGRVLGNSYAVVDIISTCVSAAILTAEIGGGFTIMTIVGLIYPVLTLILLNTTFREDLTN